jgi:outer membrane protein
MQLKKSLFLFSLLICFTTQGQITKGNFLVGGSGGFAYSKVEPKKNNLTGTNINFITDAVYIISLEPNIGYFFVDRLAGGMKLKYVNSFLEFSKFNSDGMNLNLAPFLRYYIFKDKELINLFLETSYVRFISRSLGNSNGFGLKTGLVVFFNSSVAFETSLSYEKSNNSNFNSTNIS